MVEMVGRGFNDEALNLLRARPEVVGVERQNGHLSVALQDGAQVAPLVSLVVSAGAQVEEIRKGTASLEEVFVTLMEEEK